MRVDRFRLIPFVATAPVILMKVCLPKKRDYSHFDTQLFAYFTDRRTLALFALFQLSTRQLPLLDTLFITVEQ